MKNIFMLVAIPGLCATPAVAMIATTILDATPEAKDIETDSWKTFCLYASLGEDAFKKAYHIDDINTLIGTWNSGTHNVDTLERTVRLTDGTETKVRLIGINHDDISGQGKKALFTFEFEECLTPSIPYGNSYYNINWENSNVRTFCQDVYSKLPSDLRKHIKIVDKQTFNYSMQSTEATEGEYVITQEKLFPLSYYEIAGEEDLGDPMKPFEGETYKLYFEAIYKHGYSYDHEIARSKGVINDPYHNWCTYWLRSPYYVTYPDIGKISGAYGVASGSAGASSGYYAIDPRTYPYKFMQYGVAPAFCI